MSQPDPIPDLRRIVTTHNDKGTAVVGIDSEISAEYMQIPGAEGLRSAAIWVTKDSIPTNDNNNSEDGAERKIDDLTNFTLVHPTGTNFRSTELAPGGKTAMHRTSSLDYNILISGELILIMEDGTEKLLKNPGDVVIQKGSLHAWRNPSQQECTRWVTVLIAAEPVVVEGKQLPPVFF